MRKFYFLFVLLLTAIVANAQEPLYIFGSFNSWDPNNSIPMTYENNVYTAESIEFGPGGNFAVSTVQSSDWGTVNDNRYGFATDNAKATEGVAMPIVKGEGAMQVPSAGTYDIVIDLTAMTVKVTKTADIPTFSGGTVLYLKPNSNWYSDGARFAAYFFGSEGNAWESMADVYGDGVYSVTAPAGNWTNVIFCRMNPATTENRWNNENEGDATKPMWNQTKDLTYDGVNNMYTLADDAWDKGEGSWSVYVYVEPVEGVFLRGDVNDWGVDEAYKFTETSEGVFELANIKLYGNFKIADFNWKNYNIGTSGGGFIKINQPNYLINGGDSKDMAFAGTYQCDLIKLDMTGDNPVLTVIGTATGSGIFLSSAKNNWAKDEDLSEWEFEDFGSGYYTLENNYQSNSGEFYINIHGINYGVEGSETTTLEYDETYTLVANAQKLALPAETGVEFFELNILDDEITLTVYEGEYSSIETTIADSKAPVEYFNLQGVKVNADKLNNGIYIKKQGSRTSKVLVK